MIAERTSPTGGLVGDDPQAFDHLGLVPAAQAVVDVGDRP